MEQSKPEGMTSTQAIIAQHRRLLATIEHLRQRLESRKLDSRERDALKHVLLRFLTELQEHFEVESSSTLLFTRELLAPERSQKLLELDAEHPRLLLAFQRALEAVESTETRADEVARQLQDAIQLFIAHEAEEDLLFAHA